MNITILTTSADHPVYNHLVEWQNKWANSHEITLALSPAQATGGDFLFLVSCSDIVPSSIRELYQHTLVVHASNLPEGRGWSPHVWQILEGKNDITVTLLEAEDKVDTGRLWLQKHMRLEGHELYDEINYKLFQITTKLMDEAINEHSTIKPVPQDEGGASYYSRRTPDDSRINPKKSIAEQFDMLRVADSQRFPAFFEYRGHRYIIKIEKAE